MKFDIYSETNLCECPNVSFNILRMWCYFGWKLNTTPRAFTLKAVLNSVCSLTPVFSCEVWQPDQIPVSFLCAKPSILSFLLLLLLTGTFKLITGQPEALLTQKYTSEEDSDLKRCEGIYATGEKICFLLPFALIWAHFLYVLIY